MQKEQWLLEAYTYLTAGYSIIPVRPKDKVPAVRWEPFTKQPPSKTTVGSWATRMPRNIGIVTGEVSGLVVLDLDTKRGASFEEVLEKYPTDMVAATGGGGYHLYYRWSEELGGNRVNVIPGVDVRSDGGFVVAPPSIHSSGNSYTWIKRGEPGVLPGSNLFEDDEVEDEPTIVIKDKWLKADASTGVEQGGRNDTLAKHAGYLAGKGVTFDYALELCKNLNNEKFSPPLPEEEVETTVRSVYKTEERKKKKTQEVKEKLREELRLHQLGDFIANFGDEEQAWDIEDWLPASTIGFAVAPPGSYKTWFLFDLALSIATGMPFLGHYPVRKTGPVLLVQQEDHSAQSANRLGVMAKSKLFSGLPEGSLMTMNHIPLYIHYERQVKFDSPDAMRELLSKIKEIRPVLVIVDPLYSTVNRLDDAYFDEAVQHLMPLKDIRDKYGTSFMLVHHTKKNVQAGRLRDALYGSAFLNAFLETGWQIRPYEDSTVSCYRHFKSASNTKDELFKFHIDTKTGYDYSVTIEGDRPEEEEKPKRSRPKQGQSEEAPAVSKFAVNPADLLFQVKQGKTDPKELAKELGVKPANLQLPLRHLVETGQLQYDAATNTYTGVSNET